MNQLDKAANILASLERQNKLFLVVAGYVLIGIIGFIDYLTGSEFAFSVFYVIPIYLITWVTQRRFGLVASLVSATIWFVADVSVTQAYSFPLIPFWNSLIRLAFFIIITFLLSSVKNSLELAHTDHLTSAINSRYFYDLVQMEMDRFQRNQRPFTVAYLDLDNFKVVNDKLGHLAGDQVLITLVSSIREFIRKSDLIARLGGDEFAVLFPETDQEAARIIFSKILSGFVDAMTQKNWSITFSVGILTCMVTPPSTDEVVRMADELMYAAKAAGKNTVKYSTYTR